MTKMLQKFQIISDLSKTGRECVEKTLFFTIATPFVQYKTKSICHQLNFLTITI